MFRALTIIAAVAALAVSAFAGTAGASPVGSVGIAPGASGYVTNGITRTVSVGEPTFIEIGTTETLD